MRGRVWPAGSVALALALVLSVAAAAQGGGDPQRGGELYVGNCAVCHGVDGRGRVGADLNQFPGIRTDVALAQAISQGVPGSVMPAWSAAFGGPLSDQDINDLIAYIQSAFGGTEPLAPLPTYVAPTIEPLPEVEGNPSAGAVVYQENCAVCHGADGLGRIGQTLAKAWPGQEPAVYIAEVVANGIPGTTMPAWSVERGGPLSQEQIADVAAFVLTLSPRPAATLAPAPQGPLSLSAGLIGLAVLIVLAGIVVVVYYRRA